MIKASSLLNNGVKDKKHHCLIASEVSPQSTINFRVSQKEEKSTSSPFPGNGHVVVMSENLGSKNNLGDHALASIYINKTVYNFLGLGDPAV